MARNPTIKHRAAASLLLFANRNSTPVNSVAPSATPNPPVIGTAMTYTAGTWTTGTPAFTRWEKSATGVGSWSSAAATMPNHNSAPTDTEFGLYLRPVETNGGVEAAGAAVGPVLYAGLQIWLDASDAATLFQDSAGATPATANNDVIGRWADKSGNGNHATQGTTGNKPLLKTAVLNSLNVVRLVTDDYLTTALALPNTVSALFAYANRSTGNGTLFSTNAASNAPLQRRNGAADTRIFPHQSPAFLTIAADLNPKGFLSMRWNYTADQYSGAINTTTASDTVLRNNPGGNIQFGGSGATPIEYLAGDLCEILVFNRIISDAERDAIRSYLNAKWTLF